MSDAGKWGIGDSLRRLLDQRDEDRSDGAARTATLVYGGDRHVVDLLNLSSAGAMIRVGAMPEEGDSVVLHLLDQGAVTGQVRWVRDGRVGIAFDTPLAVAQEQ